MAMQVWPKQVSLTKLATLRERPHHHLVEYAKCIQSFNFDSRANHLSRCMVLVAAFQDWTAFSSVLQKVSVHS